jgi:hypothetical protein
MNTCRATQYSEEKKELQYSSPIFTITSDSAAKCLAIIEVLKYSGPRDQAGTGTYFGFFSNG